jgi:sulfite reductase alpha subunit-like flavoprotein
MLGNRYFRYEVVGLRQNDETDRMNHPIRSSSSVFITVPYNRMNEEMQRITRMGGQIVNITPVNGNAPAPKAKATAAAAEG